MPCYTVSGTIYKTGSSAPDCNWNANGYRLPNEAEWEKAARGRQSGLNFPWGNEISHSSANYRVYSSNGTKNDYSYDVTPRPPATGTYYYHPTHMADGYPYTASVNSFTPNNYGLFNMSGNVWEWCWDLYNSYVAGLQTDPHGAVSGSNRVFRGGSWDSFAYHCRVALRDDGGFPDRTNYFIGFRLARSTVP